MDISKNSVVAGTRRAVFVIPVLAALLAGGAWIEAARAQAPADADAKRREQNVEAGEANAKQMLLIDRDQNGKVSKQEFMSFMEAEFDRLDKNKDGELDVKELVQYRFAPKAGGSRR